MNWLHASWGIGATAGPMLMALGITTYGTWRSGYILVSVIQWLLVGVILLTLPLWSKVAKKRPESKINEEAKDNTHTNGQRQKGVLETLIGFFFYCGVEMTVGLWGASYLVMVKDLTPAVAAGLVAIYYGGITAGRFLTGFLTMKLSNTVLIRTGQGLALIGGFLLIMATPKSLLGLGLLMIGIGFAPIYPGLIHETPKRFGDAASGKIIGFQMASAYIGVLTLPPLFGWVSQWAKISIFPWIVILEIAMMVLAIERVNLLIRRKGLE